MTIKEQLRARIETMTDSEAAELLRIVDQRADPLTRLWNSAPVDDEPWTEADQTAAEEGDRDIASGAIISVEELRRELSS